MPHSPYRRRLMPACLAAFFTVLGALMGLIATATSASAAQGERVQVRGEVMDTWCYFSGVMGGPDVVLGTAHHTCALWCAAGGIPVGVRTDEGEVYMVLKWAGAEEITGGDAILDVQSDVVTVDGVLHERDGVKYLIVDAVVDNSGLTNETHELYGVIPAFAIPKSAKQEAN
ncbi:MAG: hypothetical protein AAF899_04380 [Pseudomonadota bacterium]